MINHSIGNNKTMFDLFNMINPNCYQAFIIKSIIENNKLEAIQCCEELETAITYYRWETKSTSSRYIDALICNSDLEVWQRKAIFHIIDCHTSECSKVIQDEINRENAQINATSISSCDSDSDSTDRCVNTNHHKEDSSESDSEYSSNNLTDNKQFEVKEDYNFNRDKRLYESIMKMLYPASPFYVRIPRCL